MSIRSKIQALITAANATTGESDATLTDAVQTLVDGYGQGGGGSSITVEPLSVTENGTYTAPSGTSYSPVTVNVPSENPNSYNVITGTLSNPWALGVSPSVLANLLSHRNVTAYLKMTIPNAGSYILPVALDNWDNPSVFIISALLYSPVAGQSTPNGGCIMYSVANGSLISAYMYVNGTLTDVSVQLAQLPTELRLISHPLDD